MNKNVTSWSYMQSVDDLDIGRYFEYDSDALNLFKSWLPFLNKTNRVLEVGSGSGYFTNILLNLFPKIELTCLEPDDEFVKSLKGKFGDRITIVQEEIEQNSLDDETFDVAITHIVIHNLSDPIIALNQMKRVTKKGGKVVTIEPLPASRNYYPTSEISEAFDFLFKVKIIKSKERAKTMVNPNPRNPWNSFYPSFFEEVGLKNIHCHGWTSIFTTSDERYEFEEKKKWFRLRTNHLKNEQEKSIKLLLDSGEKKDDIDKYYEIIFNYYSQLENATKEELLHIHEQEILHRIIVIGEK